MLSRQTTPAEHHFDERFLSEQSIFTRAAIKCFKSTVNYVVKHVILCAFERNQITSDQLHVLAGICDRMLYPKRTVARLGVIQQNNVIGGDMCGGDMHK